MGIFFLSLIAIYELYTLIDIKDYSKMTKLYLELSKKEKNSKDFDEKFKEIHDNKKYVVISLLELGYWGTLVLLLFTSYWLVGIVLFIMAIIGNKLTDSVDKLKEIRLRKILDSIATIIIIILAVMML